MICARDVRNNLLVPAGLKTTTLQQFFWHTLGSSARKAADKYTENAGNYLMDATDFSLRTETYYLGIASGAHMIRVPGKLRSNTP